MIESPTTLLQCKFFDFYGITTALPMGLMVHINLTETWYRAFVDISEEDEIYLGLLGVRSVLPGKAVQRDYRIISITDTKMILRRVDGHDQYV